MRGKNETGGGASAETLYDALVIRGGLFLLAFPWSAIGAVTSTLRCSFTVTAETGARTASRGPGPALFFRSDDAQDDIL